MEEFGSKALERLRRILFEGGIASDIFLADEAYAISEEIGRNADAINASGFGNLFGRLQAILSDFQTVAVTKIFENETPKYPLRTVPAVLDLLEKNAEVLPIHDRWIIERELGANCEGGIGSLEDPALTRQLVEHFRRDLPPCNSTEALDALKTTRDKRIAHAEDIDRVGWGHATWGDALNLVRYAKRFLGVVGRGYLGIVFVDHDGSFFLDVDARKTAVEMRRLLNRAGLTKGDSDG